MPTVKDLAIGTSAFLVGGVSMWMGLPLVAALVPAAFTAWGGYHMTRPRSVLEAGEFQRRFIKIHQSEKAQAKELISQAFDPLTPCQKRELLVRPATGYHGTSTSLGILLEAYSEKNKWMLESLFKGLSSDQCISVMRECFQTDVFWKAFTSPDILKILFKNVTPEDKYMFLKTNHLNMSIFMHLIINTDRFTFGVENMFNFFMKDLMQKQRESLLTSTYFLIVLRPLGMKEECEMNALEVVDANRDKTLLNLLQNLRYEGLEVTTPVIRTQVDMTPLSGSVAPVAATDNSQVAKRTKAKV